MSHRLPTNVSPQYCDFCGRHTLCRPCGDDLGYSCSSCDLEDDPGDKAARFWGPILDAEKARIVKAAPLRAPRPGYLK